MFVDDLDGLVTQVGERGLTPAERQSFANGVRKAAYRDADGNEFGFGVPQPPRPPSRPSSRCSRARLAVLNRGSHSDRTVPPVVPTVAK
jgi:hypothetical protein